MVSVSQVGSISPQTIGFRGKKEDVTKKAIESFIKDKPNFILPPDSSFSIAPDVFKKRHEAISANFQKLKDTKFPEKYLTITALVQRAEKGDQGAIDALRKLCKKTQ